MILPCRSVAEAHLYLDLAGWPREGRSHRLEETDGRFVAVYEVTFGGARRVIRFDAPDPFVQGFGEGPSRLIDPGQFLAHAAALAASMPLDPESVDPAWRATGARRLDVAARCVDEVRKFIPPFASRVPPEAFFTAEGRALRAAEPARFESDRLEAVAASYRDTAARWAATPEPALRPVIRPADWEGTASCVVRPLLPLPGAPWVAYAWDPEPLRVYVSADTLARWGMTADDLHETAVSRLHRQPPPSRVANLGAPGEALPVAVCEGEYAAEQILDPDYLRQIGADLHSRRMAVAVPYRGVLLATDLEHAQALVRIAKNLPARGEPLTDQVFLASDGLLEGRVLTRS